MTQEEKQLLLKDLCARLPYGVIYQHLTKLPDWLEKCNVTGNYEFNFKLDFNSIQFLISNIETAKPYLRPMSSMTEKEKEKLKEEHKKDEKVYAEVLERIANGDESARGTAIPYFAADWCNAHHFDYRGLIEKGLAIEALEGMYKKLIS